MVPGVNGCLQLRYRTTLRPCIDVMIPARRLTLELPQILELMKVGHCLGVPFLSFLGRNLRGAHVHGHIAAQPKIRVAWHMDFAYGEVRVRRCDPGISRFERCADAKLAKIGFRPIKNILEAPASPVLLVLTLRERRNSEKNRTNKRKKPRNFSVHDIPAFKMRHTCVASKDRAGSAPSAASAHFSDRSYVRTTPQLVNKQMGLSPRGLTVPYNKNRTPAPALPILVRLVQRTPQQPGMAKIVARLSSRICASKASCGAPGPGQFIFLNMPAAERMSLSYVSGKIERRSLP